MLKSKRKSAPPLSFSLTIKICLLSLIGMENIKLRTIGGIMKFGGLSLCIAGVATIAFFKGPLLKLLVHHHLISSRIHEMRRGEDHAIDTWIKGVFLMMLSNVTWALWLLLQYGDTN
ncbi:WAT1-related protein At5g64700-like isoform X1 [Henckelia pumila]|uniref:WAT1-related protein At5g64700-like isoform X1 n=1 Tax=Henckelia pumila TaxID=405737 RepID=UPI003C6DC44D